MVKKETPVVVKQEEVKKIKFTETISFLLDGKRITRKSWENEKVFVEMKNGVLMIHKQNSYFQWVLQEVDLVASDWVVL